MHDTALEFCRQQAAPRGSAAYYATLYLTPEQQAVAWPILALQQEFNEVTTRIAEPSVAKARLDWWQGELRAAVKGHVQHPIAQALAKHVLIQPGRDALVDELLNGAYDRLHAHQPHDASAFQLLAYREQTAAWLILTDADGNSGRIERNFAHAVGSALMWTRVLHYLGRDVAQGDLLLPQDLLAQHGLDRRDFNQPLTRDTVRQLLAQLGQQTFQRFQQARSLLPAGLQHRQIMALVSLAHAEALLRAMQRENWNLLQSRPELTPLRLFWLAWRTARQAKRGRI